MGDAVFFRVLFAKPRRRFASSRGGLQLAYRHPLSRCANRILPKSFAVYDRKHREPSRLGRAARRGGGGTALAAWDPQAGPALARPAAPICRRSPYIPPGEGAAPSGTYARVCMPAGANPGSREPAVTQPSKVVLIICLLDETMNITFNREIFVILEGALRQAERAKAIWPKLDLISNCELISTRILDFPEANLT